MGKYFLGSVGTAEAFRMRDGHLELAFVSKTLTDSAISISTTKDDLRAGTGAGIVTSFYHDPVVDINLTDVLFKQEYIEAQLGVGFKNLATAYYTDEKVEVSATKLTLSRDPVNIQHCEANDALVWYTEAGKDEWKTGYATGKEVLGTFDADKKYCVRYLAQLDNAKDAEITSNIIPAELFLVITAPIFAGDACSASNGSAAGYIQYEIPRFRLNGAQDFAMNMSSNQPMSLAGSAMAADNSCEMNGSKLLRIINVIFDRKWYDGFIDLDTDEGDDSYKVGGTPDIYGVSASGALTPIDNSVLYLNDSATPGFDAWVAGDNKVSIKDGDYKLEHTFKLPAAE